MVDVAGTGIPGPDVGVRERYEEMQKENMRDV